MYIYIHTHIYIYIYISNNSAEELLAIGHCFRDCPLFKEEQ